MVSWTAALFLLILLRCLLDLSRFLFLFVHHHFPFIGLPEDGYLRLLALGSSHRHRFAVLRTLVAELVLLKYRHLDSLFLLFNFYCLQDYRFFIIAGFLLLHLTVHLFYMFSY